MPPTGISQETGHYSLANVKPTSEKSQRQYVWGKSSRKPWRPRRHEAPSAARLSEPFGGEVLGTAGGSTVRGGHAATPDPQREEWWPILATAASNGRSTKERERPYPGGSSALTGPKTPLAGCPTLHAGRTARPGDDASGHPGNSPRGKGHTDVSSLTWPSHGRAYVSSSAGAPLFAGLRGLGRPEDRLGGS